MQCRTENAKYFSIHIWPWVLHTLLLLAETYRRVSRFVLFGFFFFVFFCVLLQLSLLIFHYFYLKVPLSFSFCFPHLLCLMAYGSFNPHFINSNGTPLSIMNNSTSWQWLQKYNVIKFTKQTASMHMKFKFILWNFWIS